jgi:hypothetical protein
MAYTSSYVIHHLGGRDYRVVLTEGNATATSETTIEGLPKKGIVTAQRLVKTGGSGGSTFAPILQEATGVANAAYTVVQATAAADQNNAVDPPAEYVSADGKLYHRSVANAGTDSDLIVIYHIRAGW